MAVSPDVAQPSPPAHSGSPEANPIAASSAAARPPLSTPTSPASPASYRCEVCQKLHASDDLVPAIAVQPSISRRIRRECLSWSDAAWICREDLGHFRLEHVKQDLGEGCGVISDLESEVLRSLREDQVLAEDPNRQYERRISRSGRFAKALTTAAGSWSFLTSFSLIVAAWVAIGSVLLPGRVPDLYAFILVNTVLSGICALQAPVVLMGLRQQEERARVQSEVDYKRSLKSEVLWRQLEEKLDHLLTLEARHSPDSRAGAIGSLPALPASSARREMAPRRPRRVA